MVPALAKLWGRFSKSHGEYAFSDTGSLGVIGHARNSMGDLYDEIKEDVPFRKMWTEKCGFGFELPSVVPNVPKTAEPRPMDSPSLKRAHCCCVLRRAAPLASHSFHTNTMFLIFRAALDARAGAGEQVSGAEHTPTPARLGASLRLPTLVAGTLVEAQRFGGTCYQAANWIHGGQTSGRGRMDRGHKTHGQAVKDIYLYPLARNTRQRLCLG